MADVRRTHSNPLYTIQPFSSQHNNRLTVVPFQSRDTSIQSIAGNPVRCLSSQPRLDITAHQHFLAALDAMARNPRMVGIHSNNVSIACRIARIAFRYLSVNLGRLVLKAAAHERGLFRVTVLEQQTSFGIHVRMVSGSDNYLVRFVFNPIGDGAEKKIKEAIEISQCGAIRNLAQIKKNPLARPESPGLDVEVSLLQRLADRHIPHIPMVTERTLLRKNFEYKIRYDMEMRPFDLFDYIKIFWDSVEKNLTTHQELQFYSFACQIAEGLAGIHEANVCHLDVKPENILVDHYGQVLIIDFGNAAISGTFINRRGSLGYLSPEILFLQQMQANPSSDVWSFGVLLFVLFNGYNPFAEEQTNYQKARALGVPDMIEKAAHDFLKKLEDVHRELIMKANPRDSLISHMLALNPDDRPEMAMVRDTLRQFLT